MIYLAGPIDGCNDDEAFGWRREVANGVGEHLVLDPMRRDYRGREYLWEEIVALDLDDIRACTVLLALCSWPTTREWWGTAMELVYAKGYGKPVVAVVNGRLHPWVAAHATVIVDNLEDAIAEALARL